jgi:predicted acylesterase/phospholipase RssA
MSHPRPVCSRCECIALLLQGGGALGAYQAGVYQALSEARLQPNWVAGISIGAINAAFIAGNAPLSFQARPCRRRGNHAPATPGWTYTDVFGLLNPGCEASSPSRKARICLRRTAARLQKFEYR